jgi:hypothetical protein
MLEETRLLSQVGRVGLVGESHLPYPPDLPDPPTGSQRALERAGRADPQGKSPRRLRGNER